MIGRIGSVGFLEGLKGYPTIVRATQFSVQVDLVTAEPIDAKSVEDALLRAVATETFGILGWAMVRAQLVVPPPVETAKESA